MKLLIIGGSGQLGWELCKRAASRGIEFISVDHPDFDITDHEGVHRAIGDSQASLVVNAAAYTAVDKAESEPERAFAVNSDGPSFLASACSGVHIPLIHISTDYVFDGEKRGPYHELDPVSPLGTYGKSKAAGEEKVRALLSEHIIIRTSWLYSVHSQNFVKTMLRLGGEKETLRVVSDQIGCPTYAADLAEAILTIALRIEEKGSVPWGTYHYCGKGITSWHGFAQEIYHRAKRFDNSLKVKRIIPVTTDEYPSPAKRPANSAMDCSLISRCFGIENRPWQESLGHMLTLLLGPVQK